MNYVIYDKSTSLIKGSSATERGAKTSMASRIRSIKILTDLWVWSADGRESEAAKRLRKEADDLLVVSEAFYNENVRKTKVVRSLMTGKEIVIDINTPASCDPTTETYWSM